MNKPYNQLTALLAITKASLKAILKHPTAIVFSLAFPLIFIWIFGSFGKGGISTFKVALDKNCDTTNVLMGYIKAKDLLSIVSYSDSSKLKVDLQKGRIAAVMNITKIIDSNKQEHFQIHLTASSATNPQELQTTESILKLVAYEYERKSEPNKNKMFSFSKSIEQVRAYKQIDFVLPGQLGFSILFSTLFGIAFTFYGLREQLVLKRFYASPVNKLSILLGIGFSRLVFQLINVIAIIVIGKYMLGFTLANGIFTLFNMVFLAIVLLLILMGVGLIFSSIVKQDSTIPLLINIFALPQMLLGGTFFPIGVFPVWMQTFCKIFPLTHFNIAIRKISFEGLGILDCWQNIGVMAIWLVVVYALVYKIFKWE